jgi:hypothetical protein
MHSIDSRRKMRVGTCFMRYHTSLPGYNWFPVLPLRQIIFLKGILRKPSAVKANCAQMSHLLKIKALADARVCSTGHVAPGLSGHRHRFVAAIRSSTHRSSTICG